jgi:DNA polymerase III delta prime subunit
MEFNANQFIWPEKYRPHRVRDCILPTYLIEIFQGFVDSGEIPNMLLNGTAGVGKTTVARALCEEIGCEHIVINCGEDSSIDGVRTDMRNFATTMSMDGRIKVIILDEADRKSVAAQHAIHGFIEEFSAKCRFILTSNHVNLISDPIISRTSNINFQIQKEDRPQMAALFMRRVKEILAEERVAYDERVLAQMIKQFFPDYRKILNELQFYAKCGRIDEGILAMVQDADFAPLFVALKKKSFTEIWRWVEDNGNQEYHAMFKRLGEVLVKAAVPADKPKLVILLAEYGFKAAFAADSTMNLAACLVDTMLHVTFE